jgi:hypothetical protein
MFDNDILDQAKVPLKIFVYFLTCPALSGLSKKRIALRYFRNASPTLSSDTQSADPLCSLGASLVVVAVKTFDMKLASDSYYST